MSGETESNVSGWTTDTLKQYVDGRFIGIANLADERDTRYQQRFDAQQLGLSDALTAAEKAVAKAETAADKRFESVNEFRGQLNDQAATFLSRTEYQAQHDALEAQVKALTDRINLSEGKGAGLSAAWGVLLGAASLVAIAVTVIIATR